MTGYWRTARSLDDRVVRARDGLRHPLPQQASELMQVDCDDRDADGAFDPRPVMRAHPVQAMAFQRMNRRFHARMPLSSRHERGLTLPAVCAVET